MDSKIVTTLEHYESLIEEGNDPYRDNKGLQDYMNRWTGPGFVELMELNQDKDVLEIGIGTGRVARKVLEKGCRKLVGLDISPTTLARAKENLNEFKNIDFINENILDYENKKKFDIVYSVLTFLHIPNKELVISKIVRSLKKDGIFVVSIDGSTNNYLDCGSRILKVFPTDIKYIITCLQKHGCEVHDVINLYDNKKKCKGIKVATIIKATRLGQ